MTVIYYDCVEQIPCNNSSLTVKCLSLILISLCLSAFFIKVAYESPHQG